MLKRLGNYVKLFVPICAYTVNMKRILCRAASCLLTALPLSFVPGFSVLAAPAKPPSLGASAQNPTITVPDPKHPGKLQLLAHAREIQGVSTEGGFSGTFIKVYAQLYQLGKPSAVLSAPRAVASSRQGTMVVTATSGVTAKSLTISGTTLTADKMVWYSGQDKIVATGHVVYKDGKTGLRLTGPWAIAHTQIQSVTMGSGQASANL